MGTDPSFLESLIKGLETKVEDLGAKKLSLEKGIATADEKRKSLQKEIDGKGALVRSAEKELIEYNQRRIDAEEASAGRIESRKAELKIEEERIAGLMNDLEGIKAALAIRENTCARSEEETIRREAAVHAKIVDLNAREEKIIQDSEANTAMRKHLEEHEAAVRTREINCSSFEKSVQERSSAVEKIQEEMHAESKVMEDARKSFNNERIDMEAFRTNCKKDKDALEKFYALWKEAKILITTRPEKEGVFTEEEKERVKGALDAFLAKLSVVAEVTQ